MAFPTVAPSGYAWLHELQEVPNLALNDETVIVSVCKIAGLLPISAEMIADSSVNIVNWISGALRDSLSRDLDLGVLHGTGSPEPDGLIDPADTASGATLTAAAGAAIAEIGEAGGTADTVALSPTAYVAELTAADTTGRLLHPDGLESFLGLNIVQVPALETPLAYDSRRVFFVLGSESTVTLHDDPRHDANLLLVKARCNAVAVPKAQAIRKLTVGTSPAAAPAKKAASR